MTVTSAVNKKVKLVTCSDGSKRPEEEVINVSGCLVWINDPQITKDFVSDEWVFKGNCMVVYSDAIMDGNHAVSSIPEKFRRYTQCRHPNDFVNVIDSKHNQYAFTDEQTVKRLGFVECIKRGVFCSPSVFKEYDKWIKIHKFNFQKYSDVRDPKTGNPLLKSSSYNIKYGIYSPTFASTEGKKYTFGVELETIKGLVPNYIARDYNWDAVYDGSLKDENGESWGAEYITGVLTGDTGLLHLKGMCAELAKRCELDKKCSVHVHIGGMKINKETIIATYMLAQMIEKDVLTLVPQSRRNNSYCRVINGPKYKFPYSKISQNQRFDLINEVYTELFKLLSCKNLAPSSTNNTKTQHPLGSKCNYNHDTPRYWWINMIPMVFMTRGCEEAKTLEFRIHNGSFNFTKIKNWIKFCMGFMYFVENYTEEIFQNYEQFVSSGKSSINFNYVLEKAYPKFGNKLIQYFSMRRDLFSKSSTTAAEAAEYNDKTTDGVKSIKDLI